MSASQDRSGAADSGATRRQLVADAIETWKKDLIDLGGRNTLLYFRALRRGTLNLPEDRAGPLLAGRRVRLSALFPDPDARRDAARRARTIRAKTRENDEERGLETLYLAYGLATWSSERSKATPNAPVLLYRLALTPVGPAAEEFTLQIDDQPEINPALLHLIETDFNVPVDPDGLLEDAGPAFPTVNETILRRLNEACASVPDFTIARRGVVGNFSYAKLPMVRDLERSPKAIGAHTLLAAIAGDTGARGELRAGSAAADTESMPAVPRPEDEFLVLDADSSQSRVIAAAVAGNNLVVIGPPGTGKSQTIANLIATLVARGRSVLFVAEKRAAIEAVSKRLGQQELDDLVLDLHDGAANRRRLAEQLARSLESTREALAPETAGLYRNLTSDRTKLEDYAEQLHDTTPWGVTAFNVQQRLIGSAASSMSNARLHGKKLEALTAEVAEQAINDLHWFVELDGPLLAKDGAHLWAAAYATKRITDEDAVESVIEILSDLRNALPELREALRRLCDDAGLKGPRTLRDAGALVNLCQAANTTLTECCPTVLELDLDGLTAALAPAGGNILGRTAARLFSGRYRRARTTICAQVTQDARADQALLAVAAGARQVHDWWTRRSADGRLPTHPIDANAASEAYGRTRMLLQRFADATGRPVAAAQPLERMIAEVERLYGERTLLRRFPELHRLEDQLRRHGLGPVLDEVGARGLSAEEAASVLEYVWLASIHDRIAVRQPALAQFHGQAQAAAVRRFGQADRHLIAIGKERVKRAWAEKSVRVRDEFPDQAEQVRKQASLKRRHMPIRDLFDRAPDVLTAVKPCWVMSPLVVAQVLPAHSCFDVVVFDEASQIRPADAVSSLLRGRQAIVAGDPHQLPPTTFFTSGAGAEDDEDTRDQSLGLTEEEQAALQTGQDLALTSDLESVLDVMRALLPPPQGTRELKWHYRSRDERLITFSNAQESLYDWSLTTFPGAIDDEPLRHVLVPFSPDQVRVTASSPGEVRRVVELVLGHARTHPGESLGVIALGIRHADAITDALRLARGEHPELEEFFAEDQAEPPFVKNLERVQGDERDAIILTTGYGKTADGRMRYQFGPLTQQGGERRLNVAVTRARRRLTVVSSFAGEEMDPERLRSNGAKMLRDYLCYAASGGKDLGLRTRTKPSLNLFERDVQEQLEARGVRLVPQYGASGYWIDFAAMHPERSGEPVLAIEADGAGYHSTPTARDRDRLRQEHLERLGWRFHRIWSTEWFRHREQEVERAVEAYEDAVRSRDAAARSRGDQGFPGAGTAPQPPSERPPPLPQRDPWPLGPRRQNISEYAPGELRQAVRWVRSDGRLYTKEELLTQVIKALGFKRRGYRIVGAIEETIAAERGE